MGLMSGLNITKEEIASWVTAESVLEDLIDFRLIESKGSGEVPGKIYFNNEFYGGYDHYEVKPSGDLHITGFLPGKVDQMTLDEMEMARGKLFSEYMELNAAVVSKRKALELPIEKQRFERGFNISYTDIKHQSDILIEDWKIANLKNPFIFDGALKESFFQGKEIEPFAMEMIIENVDNVSVFENGNLVYWKMYGRVMKELNVGWEKRPRR